MIKIVVDSASDYLLQELEEKNICMAPLQMSFGAESFQDDLDITGGEIL